MTVRTLPQILGDAIAGFVAAHGINPTMMEALGAWADYAPNAIGESAREQSGGYVDPTPIADAATAVFSCIRVEDTDIANDILYLFGLLLGGAIDDAIFATPLTAAQLASLQAQVLGYLQQGLIVLHDDTNIDTLVVSPWQAAYDPTTIPPPAAYRIVCQSPGVNAAAAQAFADAVARVQEQIAKWGGASLTETTNPNALELGMPTQVAALGADPDPHVAALGFATLVRDPGPETAIFNLAAGLSGTATTTATPVTSSADGFPIGAAPTLEYKPFENRGLASRFLLEFPAQNPLLATGGAGPLAGTPGATSLPALLDLVFDVTFRACYDADLAATVRASRAREADALSLAGAIGGGPLALPSPTPERLSEMRTIRVSLRAHRDRTLQAWIAAFLEAGSPAGGGGKVPIDPTTLTTLTLGGAFTPLRPASTKYSLRLNPSGPPIADLGTLETTLDLTLADLGLPLDALTQNLDPEIVEMGVAVIPMNGGAATSDGSGGFTPGPTATVTPDSPLANLISSTPAGAAAANGEPFANRIFMRDLTAVAPTPQKLSSLLTASSSAPLALNVDVSSLLPASGSVLYDVLFSLSIRLPSDEATV